MARDLFAEAGISVGTEGRDLFQEFGITPQKPRGRNALDVIKDVGITALKGAISLPEAAVGVLDIPAGGAVGKALEDIGYNPNQAKDYLDTFLSPSQQEANAKVREADGFVDTLGAAASNPSTVPMTVLESLPSMLGGAGIARLGLKIAPAIGPVVAGALGEGVIGAGSAAEQIRGESADGLLTTKQSLSAIGSGVGTGILGFAGGKLAQKLGVADVDTLLAQGGPRQTAQGFVSQVGKAGLSEGAFEELPQSTQEQMWQNFATGKPIMEGVGNAAATGLLAGAAMGGVGGGYNYVANKRQGAVAPEQQDATSQDIPNITVVGAPSDGNTPEPVAVQPQTDPLNRLAELELASQQRQLSESEQQEATVLLSQVVEQDQQPDLNQQPMQPTAPVESAAPAISQQTTQEEQPRGTETIQTQQAEAQGSERQQAPEPVPAATPVSKSVAPAPIEPIASQQPAPAVVQTDLQNRDRARTASVIQMAGIAKNPDYMRLGPSRTPDSGAPMVFAVDDAPSLIKPEATGSEDVAVMADGQRVAFRYAVVDANAVQPSNFADGTVNPEFSSKVPGTIKALNNGRTAGIRAAHQNGKAESYVRELVADAATHGISAEAIAKIKNPMLVRVYSDASNTENMAAKSQGQGLGMSPAELAAQDAPMLDSSLIGLYQPVDITHGANRDFVRGFIGKLASAGQDVAGFLTSDGTLSPIGRNRIQAALVQRAYGDAALVEAMFDSLDSDIKTIGEVLKLTAGAWANMRDSAEIGAIDPLVDITGNLLQAVNMIRRSRETRQSLFEMTRQADLETGGMPDPLTVDVLRVFYTGTYLTRAKGRDRVLETMGKYVQAALETRGDAGLFGDTVTPLDILGAINDQSEDSTGAGQTLGLPLSGNPAGGKPAGGRAETQRPVGNEERAVVDQVGNGESGQDAETAPEQQTGNGNPQGQEGDGTAQAVAWDGAKGTFSQSREEYGIGKANPRAIEAAKNGNSGDVFIETSIRPSGKEWHVGYVSDGFGGFDSVTIGSNRDKTIDEIRNDAEKSRSLRYKQAASVEENKKILIDGANAIGVAIGKKWKGAQAYIAGNKGLTTFDNAEVIGFDEGTGAITVRVSKRGMKPSTVTTDYKSRLFENFPSNSKSTDTITDLGEKIGGARKDTATKTGKTGQAKPKDERPAWARRFEVSEIVAGDGKGRWLVRDTRTKDRLGNAKQMGGYKTTFATEQDAIDAIPMMAVAMKHRTVSTGSPNDQGEYQYEIWRDINDRKRVKVVDQVFPSRIAALEYMAKNAQAIIETSTTFGEADLPTPDNTNRTGVARRKGDVEGKDFMEAFGFRGVEFGNWNNQIERQEVMNAAYDGLMDLAEVMGIPAKAIGLNGDLALAFGARGQGLSSARAHYERSRAVINLTKMNGAGALAHEWFHALDHYLGRQDGKASSQWQTLPDGTRTFNIKGADSDMASGGFQYANSRVREALRVAYNNVMDTMFRKAETYVEDTQQADKFVARSRDDVATLLDKLRKDLSEQKDPRYKKRNNKPASAEQLAAFDAVAKKIVNGESLDIDLITLPNAKPRGKFGLSGARWTNDLLEELSAINKAVRGRSGFDATNENGVLDSLRRSMQRYSQRLKMLAEAQQGNNKTRKVPTAFAMNARELDQGRGEDYWTTPHEMAARAFQAYVEDKIAALGAQSPFLNYAPENIAILTPWGGKRPYPHGEERKAINAAFDDLVSTIQTRETESGVAVFSRADGNDAELSRRGGQGIALRDLNAIVTRAKKSLANLPNVQAFATPEDLNKDNPAHKRLYDSIVANDALGDVEGATHEGEIYLFAKNIADEFRAEHVLVNHEVGHYGLRAVFGTDIDPIMNNIWMSNAAVRKKANALRNKYGLDSNVVATEEVLVEMAPEDLTKLKGWRRLVQHVRNWLNDHGFKSLASQLDKLSKAGLSDQRKADLVVADVVNAARSWVRSGRTGRLATVVDTKLSVGSNDVTQTPEFKAWFGDSRVVDADGKPLMLYHSTGEQFTAFDIKKARSYSGTVDYELPGFYFSPEKSASVDYSNNTLAVYLSLKNPFTGDIHAYKRSNGLKTWREVFDQLQQEGYDGAIDDEDGGGENVEYIAFTPEQIKSATANNGSFDPANPDIRFSRSTMGNDEAVDTDPTIATRYEQARAKIKALTNPENYDDLIYNYQDKFIDLKRLREKIKATKGTISDLNDAYLGEELYHGRVATRVNEFEDEELKPLLAELRASGIGIEEFERFLHARHAPEANAAMAEANPTQAMIDEGRKTASDEVKALRDQLDKSTKAGSATKDIERSLSKAIDDLNRWSGAQAFAGTEEERLALSGMSDQEAEQIMTGYNTQRRTQLDKLANKIDAMNAKTLSLQLQYGLSDQETIKAWQGKYQHYVPLHRDEAHPDSKSHPIGQGFSVKGQESRRRVGSNAKVTNILAHIAMQRNAAITRGEKNTVAKKLYLLAAQNPDQEFWSLERPKRSHIDPRTGFVVRDVDPNYKNLPNVLMVKIGGVDTAIVFNEHNPTAVRLASAMKNLDMDSVEGLLKLAQKGTRWFASINTQYNPIFGVINLARDVQGAALNLSTTAIAGKQKEVAKELPAAMRAIYRTERGKDATKATKEYQALWREYQEIGGATGYRELFSDPKERQKDIVKKLGADDATGPLAASKRLFKKAYGYSLGPTVDLITDYNTAMENAVRLAAYKVAIDSGISKERAASIGKNLTVNFNRKGAKSSTVSALYAFFNASMQGTARMAQTLTGPMGRKIMYGGVLLGAMDAMLAMAVMGGEGDDDDNYAKIPDFVKERSFIIPVSRDQFVSIPMPLGYNVFPNIGRIAVEMAMGKNEKTTGQHIGNLLLIMAESFNPIGTSSTLAQTLAPTVIDLPMALIENKDWTGRTIYRENSNPQNPKPGFTMAKDSASFLGKETAQAINALTGGNAYRPGWFSPSPDQIDYIVGQLTGGVGREAMKLEQSLTSMVTGDELPAYKIPLVGRLYGNTLGPTGNAEQFYRNNREINMIENEAKGRAKDGLNAYEFLDSQPLGKLVGMNNAIDNQIQNLRQLRREVVRQDPPDRKARVEQINQQIGDAMRRLNAEVTQVKKEPAKK